MDMSEQVLIYETNKIRRQISKKETPSIDVDELLPHTTIEQQKTLEISTEHQERKIIELLLKYGNKELIFQDTANSREVVETRVRMSRFIIQELAQDKIELENKIYATILKEFSESLDSENILTEQHFIHHADTTISNEVINLLSQKDELSENWLKKFKIHTPREEHHLEKLAVDCINLLKRKRVEKMIEEKQKLLKETSSEETIINIIKEQIGLIDLKQKLSEALGIG